MDRSSLWIKRRAEKAHIQYVHAWLWVWRILSLASLYMSVSSLSLVPKTGNFGYYQTDRLKNEKLYHVKAELCASVGFTTNSTTPLSRFNITGPFAVRHTNRKLNCIWDIRKLHMKKKALSRRFFFRVPRINWKKLTMF